LTTFQKLSTLKFELNLTGLTDLSGLSVWKELTTFQKLSNLKPVYF